MNTQIAHRERSAATLGLRAAGWEGDADISDNDDSGTCD